MDLTGVVETEVRITGTVGLVEIVVKRERISRGTIVISYCCYFVLEMISL